MIDVGTRPTWLIVNVMLWPMESIGEYAWILLILRLSLVEVTARATLMSPIVRPEPEALLTSIQRLTHLLPPETVAGGSPGADVKTILSVGRGGALRELFLREGAIVGC